jgi:hypothetical protein
MLNEFGIDWWRVAWAGFVTRCSGMREQSGEPAGQDDLSWHCKSHANHDADLRNEGLCSVLD